MSRHALRHACVLLALSLPGSVLHGQAIDPTNPPQGQFIDEWAELLMQGQKVGYGHSTMTRNSDRIHTSAHMRMKLARAQIAIAIEIRQSTVETLAGEPLEFESTTFMADLENPMRTAGVIRDGVVTCTSSQFGMENTATYSLKGADGKPVSCLMTWGLYREALLRGFEPGTEYSLSAYAPEVRPDGPVQAMTKVRGDESFVLHGKPVKGRRVEATLVTPMGQVDSISWIDPADGSTLRSTINMGGLSLEMYSVDQATAVADFVPAELFMTNTVPVARRIPYKEATQITYRLSPKDGQKARIQVPETSMQKVIGREGETVTVQLTRINRDALVAGSSPPASTDLAEFLESNMLINTRDPQLVELARKAAGQEKAPLALADKLRRFVTDYIEAKGMDVAFGTASDVCRSKRGDCSEHAVLLAALGRINGLPSRVAVGLAYVPLFGNQQDIFGFHMWTQFFIAGTWVDFDAALQESDCSPTRIAFDVSSLRETALVEMSFKLMEVFGRLKLEVLDIQRAVKDGL